MDASQQDFNACVNCGNTLANWSELCQPKEAVRLLHDAVLQYNAALQLDREDNEVISVIIQGWTKPTFIWRDCANSGASGGTVVHYFGTLSLMCMCVLSFVQVWQNLGDALIQLGKNLCESDRQHEGEECFREAIDAYSQSCGLSDSRKGDDLPGLLENWGIGLVTASKCVEVRNLHSWNAGTIHCTIFAQIFHLSMFYDDMSFPAASSHSVEKTILKFDVKGIKICHT